MALFNRIKIWNTGEVLKAVDLDAEFANVYSGFIPNKIDGLSTPTSAMLTAVSPGSTGSESPAGSLGDEIYRLRYVAQHIKGTPNWYTPLLDNQTPTPQEITLSTLKTQLDGVLTNLMPPGLIAPYGGTTAPSNWLLCDGTAYARTGTYSNLFTAIGTAFGYGDNSTTFNVPDLRGMFLRGNIGLLSSTGSGTINSTDYNATFTAHGLRTGMRIMFTGGAIGATTFTGAYTQAFVRVIDANTLQFYASPTAATNIGSTGGLFTIYTGANTATIRQTQDPDTASHFRQTPGANATGVGSGQGDAMPVHNHDTTSVVSGNVSSNYVTQGGALGAPITSLNSGNATSTVPNMLGYAGSSLAYESRPLSTTVNYIIRY